MIKGIWESYSWYCMDAIVAALALGFAYTVWRLSRREYWRLAAREVMQKRLAMLSFFVICVYVAIALVDSVGWHPRLRDAKGEPMRDTTGNALTDPQGVSLLDWLCAAIRKSDEKTYSAPMADRQFTRETVVTEDGKPQRIEPQLKYPGSHLMGTDKVGKDVFYLALKGARTAIIIGGLTTILAIPFAIFFGIAAGYFGGWIDDLIQYVYTVLSSIPSVLLIVAFIVIFDRGLLQLCIIMGITSWTNLCRVLRGETLKLREAEFIQSAQAMGVPSWRILLRHVVPNVMHVVLINAVLRFSALVLIEAALTYMGIGVGADTESWGKMINDARLEMARDPMVWWKLVTAFAFMLGLVLPANIFGDAVRDALDPRLRTQ